MSLGELIDRLYRGKSTLDGLVFELAGGQDEGFCYCYDDDDSEYDSDEDEDDDIEINSVILVEKKQDEVTVLTMSSAPDDSYSVEGSLASLYTSNSRAPSNISKR